MPRYKRPRLLIFKFDKTVLKYCLIELWCAEMKVKIS